jgi:predicted dehydrogenase
MSRRPTRRTFLKCAAAAAVPLAVPSILRGSALAQLNIGAVGVGGKGESDLAETSKGQNVVAICDADERTLENAARRYPMARKYTDWRRLLEQKDVEAVTVSTPDHMHAPVAVSAMRLGKHVYVQKPLAHTVFEARAMRLVAREHGVVTQMGNQGHSGSGYRTVAKLIREGAIGKVREAHTWSDRPIWPQGIGRPEGSSPVPAHLHWDLWLGVAPERPYVELPEGARDRGVYHPFKWRGWLDFGVGALGDMGCHIIDLPVGGLELGAPRRVWSDGPAPNGETYPHWEIIHWEFDGTAHTASDPFRLTWYDGGRKPCRELARLAEGEEVPSNGSLFIGEKGVLLAPHGGRRVALLPEADFRDYRIEGVESSDHYMQWTNACLGGDRTTSSFDYAGPLTETVLLGTIASQFPWRRLEWDTEALAFRNCDEATRLVHKPYRAGWEVPGLSPTAAVGSAAGGARVEKF